MNDNSSEGGVCNSLSQWSSASTTEMYALTTLEAGSLWSGCQQGWLLLRPLSLVCRRPSSPCVFHWSSLCVRLCLISSSHRDMVIMLGHQLSHLFKDPISSYITFCGAAVRISLYILKYKFEKILFISLQDTRAYSLDDINGRNEWCNREENISDSHVLRWVRGNVSRRVGTRAALFPEPISSKACAYISLPVMAAHVLFVKRIHQ